MSMYPEESIDSDWTERELLVLRSADLDVPPQGADDRTLVALGLAAAGVGAGAGVTTATVMKAAGQAPLWLKWAGIALLGGGLVSAVLLAKHRTIARAPDAASAPAATQLAIAAAEPSPSPSTPEPPLASPLPPLETAAKPSDAADRKDASKNTLSDEIRLIDEARARLHGGDAAGSLEALNRYDQLVKRGGSMRAEATVVRIEALQASGAGDRARVLGERFVAMNPKSPYADYVRQLLARGD